MPDRYCGQSEHVAIFLCDTGPRTLHACCRHKSSCLIISRPSAPPSIKTPCIGSHLTLLRIAMVGSWSGESAAMSLPFLVVPDDSKVYEASEPDPIGTVEAQELPARFSNVSLRTDGQGSPRNASG